MKKVRTLSFALALSTVSLSTVGLGPVAGVASAADQVTAIDALVVNQTATIRGLVKARLDHDEFMLEDDSGEIRIDTGRPWTDYEIGDTVTVSGQLDDDQANPEFYAQSITLYDGTVVRLGEK